MSDIERRILNGTRAHALSAIGSFSLETGGPKTAPEWFAYLMDYSDRIAEQIAWRKFRGVNT